MLLYTVPQKLSVQSILTARFLSDVFYYIKGGTVRRVQHRTVQGKEKIKMKIEMFISAFKITQFSSEDVNKLLTVCYVKVKFVTNS